MNHRAAAGKVKRLHAFVSTTAAVSIAVGLSVQAAWNLHIAALLTWGGSSAMAPSTATCVILCGFSLWLQRRGRGRPFFSRSGIVPGILAMLAALTALQSLAGHLFSLPFNLESLLLLRPPTGQIAGIAPLMSPITAAAWLQMSLALLMLDWRIRRKIWPAEYLLLGVVIAILFGVLNAVLGPSGSIVRVSPPTLTTSSLLLCGVVFSRANWAAGGLLAGQSAGARLLQRALPAGLLVLALMGRMLFRPLFAANHFNWVQGAALAVVAAAMLAFFIGWMAFLVDRGQSRPLWQDQFPEQAGGADAETRLQKQVKLGIAAALLLTSVVGLLAWRMATQAAFDADWVIHSYQVSSSLESALRHMDEVEAGSRGFAFMGAEEFRPGIAAAQDEALADLAELRLLVSDSPEQEQRLSRLLEQCNARMSAARQIVAIRQSTGQAPSPAEIERGNELMLSVRRTEARMENEEARLLQQRVDRARDTRRSTGSAIGLGSLFGMVFLSIAGVSLHREIRISVRSQALVRAMNTNLEQRVAEGTAELRSEFAARAGAEAQLRVSEESQRMLLDGIKDYAVYMLDAQGHVTSWNSGAARIKGYRAEEILGRHFSCFYTAGDRDQQRPERALQQALLTGHCQEEGWRVRRNGSEFWADVIITPVYEINGSLRGYSNVLRDVTLRRQSEEQLQKQAALLDLADDAILVRDSENRIVFWNRGAQRMYGWSAQEASGRISHELLQTKFPLPLGTIEALAVRQDEWEGEVRHRSRSGAELMVASRWSLQRDQKGACSAILEINRDITDRKQAEIALSESEGRLAGIISSAMDPIITVDEQQRIVMFNSAAEKVFRCTAAETIGGPIARFIPQRFHAVHATHIARFDQTGTTNRTMGARSILWAVRADGQEFRIEASISQVVTGGKKLFTIILRDVTERIQGEMMREKLAAIVDSSEDAIISKTLDGTITAWNRGAEKVFGYTAAELVGNSMLILLPAERRDEEYDILARIRRGESVEHFETVRVRKDGQKIDVSVTISPIRDGDGSIIGASKIARDITERKRAEQALREKEHLLSESQRIAHVGSWTNPLQADGRLTWSEETFRVYGVSPETFTPTVGAIMALILPEDRPLMQGFMTACAAGHKPPDFEFRILLSDGTVRLLNGRGELQRDAEDKPARMVGTVQDITEHRRAELALRESENRFQIMVDGIPQLAWMADPDGSIFWYNQRWYDFTGSTFEQMQGWGWQSVQHPDFLPGVISAWKKAIAEAKPLEMEFPLRGADGLFHAFLTRVLPFKDSSGCVVRWFGTNTDISERKRAEEQLAMQAVQLQHAHEDLEEKIAKRTEQLAAANHELEAFSYSVSHDLRTPMRHISSFSRILVQEYGTEMTAEAREHLQRIQDAVRRMGQLVDALLKMATLRRQPLRLQRSPLNPMVEQVISLLQPECEGRAVEWRIAPLPTLDCDPVLMAQVFQNLLSNALKYSRGREKAIVEVGSFEEPGMPAVLWVRDNGAGFDMNYAEKLFGMFQRLHTEEEFEGTGVGLATVHRIIEKHRGAIWAEAEPGLGACFYFALQVTEEAAKALKSNLQKSPATNNA